MRRAYLPLRSRLLEVSLSLGGYALLTGVIVLSSLSSYFVVLPTWLWLASLVQLVVLLAVGVFFISWLKRACWNANAIEPGCVRSQASIAGAWFIPVVSLYRPLQFVHDVWRAARVGNEALPGVWWAAFQSWGWVSFCAWWLVRSWELLLAAQALGLVASILALAVVVQASNGLDRRRDALGLEGAPATAKRFIRQDFTASDQLEALGTSRSD